MYLKSIKINNYRKFGENNNTIEFVNIKNKEIANENSEKSNKEPEELNIASQMTLIVGQNNTGKTSLVSALDMLLKDSVKFNGFDFNIDYLNELLEKYKNNNFDNYPQLQFDIKIGIDVNNQNDLLTNLAPMLLNLNIDTKECIIRIIYEIKEKELFDKNVKSILEKYKEKEQLFDKFIELIDKSDFNLNYYTESEGENIQVKDFKLNDLISLSFIKANNIKSDDCLTIAFNKIVEYKYKSLLENNELSDNQIDELPGILDEINGRINNYFEENHSSGINKAIKEVFNEGKCQIVLKSEITIKKLLFNIVKFYFKEKERKIPETQFGLGYTHLIRIVSEIIDYFNKYNINNTHSKINLIAIEEPETFMHPQMQELFIKKINEMIKELLEEKDSVNSQLIVTTHSSHILNSKIHQGGSFNNINYFTNDGLKIKVINLSDDIIENYDKNCEIEEKDSDTANKKRNENFNFIKKHIKYKISEIFFADAAIFVEGLSEATLLPYYLDNDENLCDKYITIIPIDGAFAKVYNGLIQLINIPTLIITDIDFKRDKIDKKEKKEKKLSTFEIFKNITDLKNKCTTNDTLKFYMKKNGLDNLENYDYFEDNNLKVVFQKNKEENQINYATSFEEAFILANYDNTNLHKILKTIKPRIFNNVNEEFIKNRSYYCYKYLSDSKSEFAIKVLYDEMNNDGILFKMPNYIVDGLNFLRMKLNNGENK